MLSRSGGRELTVTVSLVRAVLQFIIRSCILIRCALHSLRECGLCRLRILRDQIIKPDLRQ